MMTFDEIMFEIRVKNLSEDVQKFLRWIPEDGSEPDDFYGGYTYQAYCVLNKSSEQDEEVPATHGTRRPANRGERRKATAHAKNRRKSLAKYADDEIRTNSGKVVNTGWRSYEKGNKLYTRKGRVAREKFTEEPTLNMDEDDSLTIDNTGLYLDKNQDIWTDEEISQSIEYFRYEHDHNDDDWDDFDDDFNDDFDEDWDEDDEEEYDFGYDPYQNAIDDREAAWDEISDLKRQINIYKDFIGEFNLNTLYERWLAIR